jgi:hypothetical protein
MCKYDTSRKIGWQQYTVQPKQTPHTKFCTLFLRGKINTTFIHQTMYWIIREYLFVYIFVSNYYSHKSSNWNREGWVGYGMHCMCSGLHFLYGKINYIMTEFFMH